MEQIYHFITLHASKSPWILFSLFILAGLNFPISIDLLVIIASIISASIAPELKYQLFFSCVAGTVMAGWTAYFVGHFLGSKLMSFSWFKKLFPVSRLDKIHSFYTKYGLIALIIGRFIPFGIRNAMFITNGMAKSSFKNFASKDLFAATFWCTIMFHLFHSLGCHFDTIVKYLKIINISLFSLFSVAVIIFFCYKRRKAMKSLD